MPQLYGLESFLQKGFCLFTTYRGKTFKEAFKRLTRFEVVDKGIYGHSST